MDTIDWLLDSDPAISWQAMRDLTDASPAAVTAERARVPREGVGAEILAHQGSDGSWHRAADPVWLPTLYTMLLLRATGVDRADPAVDSAVARLEAGFQWDEEFRDKPFKPFFEGEVEPCINGGTLALGAYFGRPTDSLARHLVAEQLDDGGWKRKETEVPFTLRSGALYQGPTLVGPKRIEKDWALAPAMAHPAENANLDSSGTRSNYALDSLPGLRGTTAWTVVPRLSWD